MKETPSIKEERDHFAKCYYRVFFFFIKLVEMEEDKVLEKVIEKYKERDPSKGIIYF